MSLLNEQRRRNQTMQQVKELARSGQWAEAKKLVDTMSDTPDVIRIRNSIEKQLYIATGEVPAVMEGSPAIAESGDDLTAWVASDTPPKKAKRADDKTSLHVANGFLQLLSAATLLWGIITFLSALTLPGRYSLYSASAPQITQIYTEATFVMAQAIALFTFAGALQISILASKAQSTR